MTLTHLLRRRLVFHRRGNQAVLLGVAVGAAVLTGALLVGDSLRGSLRERALRQLAGVENLLVSTRLLDSDTDRKLPTEGVVDGILLRGTAAAGDRRVNDVTVID